MVILFLIITITIITFSLMILIKLKVIINYSFKNKSSDVEGYFILFLMIRIPFKRSDSKKDKSLLKILYKRLEILKDLFNTEKNFFSELLEVIKNLKKYLYIEQLNFRILAGIDDSKDTAILSGLLWSAAGILESFITNNIKIHKKSIEVVPLFNKSAIETNIFCIFILRPVNIIIMIIRISLLYLKYLKGIRGESNDTSHRRAYDNSYGKHKGHG